MFSAIGLALKLFAGKALAAAKNIPWQVWAVAALVLAIGVTGCVHLRNDKAAVKAADAAGYTRAMVEVRNRALEIERKAKALDAKITTMIRNQADAENRVTTERAGALLLRGPGRAACSIRPAVPGSAGGHDPAGGGADVAPAGLPEPDRIAVPFGYAVKQGATCDGNLTEVKAWRKWHKSFTEAWAKLAH